MKIHPTAIIDKTAQIDESVEIGPYTVIEKNVTIGAGTVIASSVRIYGNTQMGKNNRIYHGAVIGAEPQDLGYDRNSETGLIIGDGNIFREGANIHRGTKPDHPTTMGNNNYFMGNFHVGHDCHLGDSNIFTHGTVLAGHVDVGNFAFISGVVAVHQHVNVGDYAMVAGCSKIVKDVPPYATADGNPATVIGMNAVGMKRAGMPPEARNAIKHAYKIIYHSGMNTSQAVAELKKEKMTKEVQNIVEFIEKSDRGITDHR